MNVSLFNKNTKEYIAVLIAILGMGSLYFQVLHMPIMAIMLVSAAGIMMIGDPHISGTNFKIYALFTGLFLLTSLINYENGFRINDLIIWLVNCFFIAVLQSHMTFEDFKYKFVRLMTIECTISLICFVWVYVMKKELPLTATIYNNINGYILTPYYTIGWTNLGIFDRNAGLTGEPGAHQIFISFALLFILSDDDRLGLSKRRYRLCILILIATLLTTKSTAGYMCLAVVLTSVMMKGQSSENSTKIKVFVLIAMIVLIAVESNTGIIEDKFAGIETGHGSGKTRYNDTFSGFMIALKHPVFGHGAFASNLQEILTEYHIANISNGMASFAIKNGVIITFMMSFMVIRGIKRLLPYGFMFTICAVMLYLICINSQSAFSNLLFLAFLGKWKSQKPRDNVHVIHLTHSKE